MNIFVLLYVLYFIDVKQYRCGLFISKKNIVNFIFVFAISNTILYINMHEILVVMLIKIQWKMLKLQSCKNALFIVDITCFLCNCCNQQSSSSKIVLKLLFLYLK